MTSVYLAIGHGEEPNGTFDPGAVHGKLVEHTLAGHVVDATVAAFERSGFHDFIAENDHVAGKPDPDYRGSVIRANAAHAAVVCEVHFNAGSMSGHGTETLFYPGSVNGHSLALHVQDKLATAVGIDNRGIKDRSDLWLLRGTTGAAIIPEVAFVDGDNTAIEDHPQLCTNAGEAIARGILYYLGKRYVPPNAPRFEIYIGDTHTHVTNSQSVDAVLATVKHLLATGTREVMIERMP